MTEGQIHVFKHKGRRYATGLSWLPVASDVTNETLALERARELAGVQQPPLNRHIIQNDPKTQRPLAVGLGYLKSGSASSFALTLIRGVALNAPARSWMSLTAVPGKEDQFVFVAVLNDAVMPGSDRLFGFDEALEWARQRLSLGVWEAVFVDPRFVAELNDATVREATLDSLIAGLKAKDCPKLQSQGRKLPPKVRKYGPFAIGAVVLIGAGLAGLHIWQQRIAEQREAAMAAIHPPPPPKPWLFNPAAHTVLLECVKALSTAPVTRSGWSFDSLDCQVSGSQLTTTVNWKQGKGELADLLASEPAVRFDAKKGLASLSHTVKLAPRRDDAMVLNSTAAAIRLDDLGQRYGITELTEDKDIRTVLASLDKSHWQSKTQHRMSSFKTYTLKFVRRNPVFTLSQLDSLFTNLPGLRFDNILVDRTGQFTVTGKLYAYQ